MGFEYQEVNTVPTNTETTVLSFTNTGDTITLESLGFSGTSRAEMFFYINTILKMKRRTTDDIGTLKVPMYNYKVANGDIVDIKVKHYESANQDFQAEVNYG